MPSPTWSTVPTSARSVSTSKSLIRSLRMAVISSGRSFTRAPFQARVTSSRAEAVPGGRARSRRRGSEPAWRTMPPIRSGSTVRVASTVRPEALLDLLDDRARLVLGELERGGQLDGELRPPRAAASRSNSSPTSSTSPPRPFSTSSRRRLRTSESDVAGDGVDGGELRPLVELGVAQDLRELRHLALGLDEVAELLPRLCELPALLRTPRTATARTCGERPTSRPSRSAPAPRSRGR